MRTRLAITILLSLLVSPGAAAQSRADSPWAPYFGCWRATESLSARTLTCVLPVAEPAVARVVRLRDGVVQSEQELRADGRSFVRQDGECESDERITPSADGARLELQGRLRCGTRPEQRSSGLHAIVQHDWLEVASLRAVDGRPVVRVVRRSPLPWDDTPPVLRERLEPVERLAVAARAAVSLPVNVERVVAVARAVEAPVAEAWMVEAARGSVTGMRLDREDLETLGDADLPASVIDLAVALANPRHFQLDVGGRPVPVAALTAARGAGGDAWEPMRMPMMNCFAPSYLGIGAMPYITCMDVGAYPFVSQWGFTRWGTYPGYFPGYGYPITVLPPGSGAGSSQDNGGRVIRGRGYTQREGAGSGSAQPSGRSAPASKGGGRSGSTGRTAKPRKP